MAAGKEVSRDPLLFITNKVLRIFCRLWASIGFEVLFVISVDTAPGRDSW